MSIQLYRGEYSPGGISSAWKDLVSLQFTADASNRAYVPTATITIAFGAFFFMHDVRSGVYLSEEMLTA